jgi:hypothetical protein
LLILHVNVIIIRCQQGWIYVIKDRRHSMPDNGFHSQFRSLLAGDVLIALFSTAFCVPFAATFVTFFVTFNGVHG